MDLKRACSDTSRSAKSSCNGSAQKAKRRATLRELMQLPVRCESPKKISVSQITTSEHLERQEQDKLEQLEVVPKRLERLGIWKCVKGISWNSLFKPRDTENNKTQRNNNGGAYAKLTKLWKMKRNLRGNEDLQPHGASSTGGCCDGVSSPCRCGGLKLKTSFGVEQDDEHSYKSSADEKHNIKENELVEDGDKAGCRNTSFDIAEVEKDVNEESLTRNLQQKDSTNLDVGLNNDEMCEEFNDHMLAKLSYGAFAEKSRSQNASALISADYGSPIQNAAAALMSQSKIWEYFELIDVWTAEEERLKKQAVAEEERLNKQEAVAKEYKWWRILSGDKGRSWSFSSGRNYKQHQRKKKECGLPRDNENKNPPRRCSTRILPK